VGLLAAAMAAEIIWGTIESAVRLRRTIDPVDWEWSLLPFLFGVICALCAWGILRWRSWGYVLAVGISAFALFVGTEAFLMGDSGAVFPIVVLLVLTWLLLTPVRVAYWRRVPSS
jgi:hypothetical protein